MSFTGVRLGVAGDSDITVEGAVMLSNAGGDCICVDGTELKPFLGCIGSFWGEEDMELGNRRVCVDLCSYIGP